MAVILFALAILLLWLAGLGLYFLLTQETNEYCIFEMLGLSFLLGVTFVALGSLLASLFLPTIANRIVLTILCLGLGMFGVWQATKKSKSQRHYPKKSAWKFLPVLLLVAQILFVGWVGMRTTLSWDGLFNWEMKAKVFYEQGGITKHFLQSDALAWAHVDYPPLLPLNQAWVYAWLGGANQNAGKMFCVLFYPIAVFLLLAGKRTSPPSRNINYALLMFAIPITWIGDGSATTGHADFSVAVFYLAAAKLLTEFVETGESNRLKLMGAISLGLAFIKQDSFVLLIALLLVSGLVIVLKKMSYRWLLVLLPALSLYSVWKLSMRLLSPYFSQDFQLKMPTSWQALIERGNAVGRYFFWEMLNPLHWGALWVVFFILLGVCLGTMLLAGARENKLSVWALVLLVLLPLGGDFVIYLFIGTSAEWLTLEYWLTSSAARLMLQISLLTLFSIPKLVKLSQLNMLMK